MKILILEDSKDRIAQFRKNLAGHEVVFVYETMQCIDQLDIDNFDALFLDHDLGGKILQPSDYKSGYAVAEWLARHPERQPPIIVIHSLNPIGAGRMKMALPNAYRLPCAWTMEGLFRTTTLGNVSLKNQYS